MGTLRDEMRKRGANEAQLGSKTMQMAEEIFADKAVDGLSEANGRLDALNAKADRLKLLYADAEKIGYELERQSDNARDVMSGLIGATGDARKTADKLQVKDAATIDALNAYSEVLRRTKEIVGGEMTETIWVEAVQAASYCAWRSIMGPKEKQDSGRKNGYRAL